MKKRKLINRTTYLRANNGYTSISNEATYGKLSAGALGILVMLLSNVDTFIIYKSEIEKRSGFGETKFNDYWDELDQNGFILAQFKTTYLEFLILYYNKHSKLL